MNKLRALFQRNKQAEEFQRLADQAAQTAQELRKMGRSNIRRGRPDLAAALFDIAEDHQGQARAYQHGANIERSKVGK